VHQLYLARKAKPLGWRCKQTATAERRGRKKESRTLLPAKGAARKKTAAGDVELKPPSVKGRQFDEEVGRDSQMLAWLF